MLFVMPNILMCIFLFVHIKHSDTLDIFCFLFEILAAS